MKRTFVWLLALVAIVFGLFAFSAPAPTLALDTGPTLSLAPLLAAEHPAPALLSVDTVAQRAASKSTEATITATATEAELESRTGDEITAELRPDPGNVSAGVEVIYSGADSLATPPKLSS